MNVTSLVVDTVMLLVFVAIVVAVVRAWRARPARVRLTPLPPEARRRYVAAWARIQIRFRDAPEEAVQEANSLLIALLGARGHPLTADRLPRQLRKAWRKQVEGRRMRRTDDLRRAMRDYRVVFDQMIGPEQPAQVAGGRRETA